MAEQSDKAVMCYRRVMCASFSTTGKSAACRLCKNVIQDCNTDVLGADQIESAFGSQKRLYPVVFYWQ